ncbi:hypothetical protein PSTG_14172 [Puccinia striiformis f. sp. tritici PST-78]|uniref:Uncharacterized protein n=1 Tax=Puccinia striiformis f. sp. tritici PST-78 TaxID=1165861 RepID=A0A0L0UZU3_9BASI|nr:hypothetical protein PSTG_14172 [Puccinia striiformis f. sp. tritici PST-78]
MAVRYHITTSASPRHRGHVPHLVHPATRKRPSTYSSSVVASFAPSQPNPCDLFPNHLTVPSNALLQNDLQSATLDCAGPFAHRLQLGVPIDPRMLCDSS